MVRFQVAAVLTALIATPGCAPDVVEQAFQAPGHAAGATVRFRCGDEDSMAVRHPDAETAVLGIGADEFVLQRQRAASGARYAGEGIEFWNKGNQAMLTVDGETYDCLAMPIE